MDLSKHWDDGNYAGPGWHLAVVNALENGNSKNTGTPYCDVKMKASGKDAKLRLFLTEDAQWRIASFAKACGKTLEQLKSFEMKHLLNCRVQILIEKVAGIDGGKGYHEVADWLKEGEERYEPVAAPASTQEPDGPPSGDDVPF